MGRRGVTYDFRELGDEIRGAALISVCESCGEHAIRPVDASTLQDLVEELLPTGWGFDDNVLHCARHRQP